MAHDDEVRRREEIEAKMADAMRAIEAEPDAAKRQRIHEQLMDLLSRERAAALVAIVEDVRAKAGDEAAEQTLKALREFEAKTVRRKRRGRTGQS